ncbi:hypothetical protein Tco_0592787 [Tanacetum coccineum]
MLDSEDSTITYTAIPDYIPGPEESQSPPLPDFVPEPVYLEFMPPEDEILPAKEQHCLLLTHLLLIHQAIFPSPILRRIRREDDDEDPEEDPANYPADGGDEGDDEDEPSDDDEDDEVDIEADDEEEEHPAPADSTAVALPAIDQALRRPSPLAPTPVWSDAEVARPLAISTPPSSLLSSWSSPLPQIPSPPLPPILSPLLVSPPLPVSSPVPVLSPSPPASPIRLLGYRAAMIRLRAEAASTYHSLPLPPPIILSHTRLDAPSSRIPPMHLLSTDRRADRPEVTLPPQKRLGITLGPRYEVRESSSAAARPAGDLRANYGFIATMDREIRRDLVRDVGYRITDFWDKIVETMQGAPASADTELGRHMTEFETRVRQDTDEIYTRLDDEQTERQLLAGRLNM